MRKGSFTVSVTRVARSVGGSRVLPIIVRRREPPHLLSHGWVEQCRCRQSPPASPCGRFGGLDRGPGRDQVSVAGVLYGIRNSGYSQLA